MACLGRYSKPAFQVNVAVGLDGYVVVAEHLVLSGHNS